LLAHLSAQCCKEVEFAAVRVLKTQRIPAGANNEVGTVLLHEAQIVGSGIETVAQDDFARLVRETLQVLRPAPIGQRDVIDLSARQIVSDMQTPGRTVSTGLANRGRVNDP
jgi:hypothetical protein